MKQLLFALLPFGLLAGTAVLAQSPASGSPPPGGDLPDIVGPATNAMPAAPPPPGNTPRRDPVVARGPSVDLAVEAARAAVKSCEGKHIGVAILDQSGQPKLIYIPDGTAGSHAFMAFRKANTALLIKAPSNQVTARAAADQALAAKVYGNPDYISFGGGLPIMANGEVRSAGNKIKIIPRHPAFLSDFLR